MAIQNAPIDQNFVKGLLAASSVDGSSTVKVYADPTTHRLLVDSGGSSSINFADNEVVSGSGTSWTLANTPTAGSQHVYANGQRLIPGGGQDYTIAGAVITTALSWAAGTVLADYRY